MATLDLHRNENTNAKVIVVTGQGEKENALRAVGAGAYDFMCKPVNLNELQFLVRRCSYVAELELEYTALKDIDRESGLLLQANHPFPANPPHFPLWLLLNLCGTPNRSDDIATVNHFHGWSFVLLRNNIGNRRESRQGRKIQLSQWKKIQRWQGDTFQSL